MAELTDKELLPERSFVRYWLCCGNNDPFHGESLCFEMRSGLHPGRCRYGTADEHRAWLKQSAAASLATEGGV
jgi:hypothetical protein